MGRITPSFRQLYLGQIEHLRSRSGFQNTLIDLENSRALDSLIKEAWSPEGAAMAQANIPAVLDVMNLMASVHNKSASDALRKRVEELEKRLQDLDPEGAEKIRPDLPVPPSICYGPIRRRRAQRRLRFETTLTRVSSGTSEIFGRSSRLCQGPCLGSH
jgi:hypothetical protein